MAHVTRETVTIAVDASGDGTGYTGIVSGLVQAIRYVKTDYANGVDVAVTAESSGLAIVTCTDLNASADIHPRAAVATIANAAALYAAGGVAVLDRIPVANERVKIIVSSGGVSKTGTFHVYIEG